MALDVKGDIRIGAVHVVAGLLPSSHSGVAPDRTAAAGGTSKTQRTGTFLADVSYQLQALVRDAVVRITRVRRPAVRLAVAPTRPSCFLMTATCPGGGAGAPRGPPAN
jgi:hypothetical protein